MSTISNVLNSQNLSIQSNNQVSSTQGQPKVHHHHHKKNDPQDSVQISDEGKAQAANSGKNPLDSLVANGTITQDQEDSIKNAFMSARQANQSGIYGSKPTSPLSSLVANGTITQNQADSITNAFKANGAGGHHHHKEQQTDTNTDVNQPILQTSSNNNSIVNDILENTESQDSLAESLDN